jgi:hypothetical protein
MDPNLFHLDWERVFEVLVAIVLMAFLVERALAVLFETRFFIRLKEGREGEKTGKDRTLKEPIAFVVAVLACWYWDLDSVSMIFLKENVTIPGVLLTGGIVAGGSKASIKLFRDWLKFMSSAERERQDLKAVEAEKKLEEAKSKGGSGK